VLGPRHPNTLINLVGLGTLYLFQGRYGEAEPLYLEALKARREVLGPRHPDTLISVAHVAANYYSQGRYREAEPLYREALQSSRELRGARHPYTLINLYNLAELFRAQGRYGKAEPLYREALQSIREVLGPRHPSTLIIQLGTVHLLVNQKQRPRAVRTLQQMESHLLGWVGQELYSTEASAVRRQLVSSQASFQDVALTLAMTERSSDARRLASNSMLRFKLLQGEEEAYLLSLTRRSQDPRVRALAEEVSKLRATLASAAWVERGDFDRALQALEAKQLALGAISRGYTEVLRVQTANLNDLRSALPASAVLIEFRQFQPVDFRTRKLGEPRFAAVLLAGSDEPMVADLGPVSEMRLSAAAFDDETAAALYQRLFAPFEQKLAAATRVYLAPDGILNLVPFAQLKLADRRFWAERQEVRLLQSGRDLLRPDPDKPARGLLALGSIDFGVATEEEKPTDAFVAAGLDLSGAVTRTARTFRDGFKPLGASGDEAIQIKEWYQLLRKDEPAEVWSGADASKSRLMSMTSPPRVLHLATHGFYFADEARDPMLHSGVALAGANHALADRGKGDSVRSRGAGAQP
jgi:tetratricopeptide (TPR) repeat protein